MLDTLTTDTLMTDTVAIQERIGELCHQFRLPTMGAQSVSRFTAAGHGDALETLLEVLEQEPEDRRLRRFSRLRTGPGAGGQDLGNLRRTTVASVSQATWGNWPTAARQTAASNVLSLQGLPGTGPTRPGALGHRLVRVKVGALRAILPRPARDLAARDVGPPATSWCSGPAGGLGSDRLSGHSGRIGRARRMVAAGAPSQAMQRQGRWRQGDMVSRYTRGEAVGEALKEVELTIHYTYPLQAPDSQ